MADETASLFQFNQFQLSKKVGFLTQLSAYLSPLSKRWGTAGRLWNGYELPSDCKRPPHFQNGYCYSTHVLPTYLNWHLIFKYSVYLYPIVVWQTVNCFVRRSLGFKNYTVLKKKRKNISDLTSGNKLILKPALEIDEVIEHLTSNKNNIEVVNLSSRLWSNVALRQRHQK